MIRKYIIVADDSIKGFDEGIENSKENGAEEIEPCKDCVSGENALNMPNKQSISCVKLSGVDITKYPNTTSEVNVTPQGKWIDLMKDNHIPADDIWRYSCDQCNCQNNRQTNYCPNCSAKMMGCLATTVAITSSKHEFTRRL